MKNEITIKPEEDSAGRYKRFLVYRGEVFIGFYRKIKNTKTDRFPYQAFAPPPRDGASPNRLLGSFYGYDGSSKAVNVIVENGGER